MKQPKQHSWGELANHVTLLTAKHGEKENAMPASWATVLSYKPYLVAVSISPLRHSYKLVKDSGKFALNLLADDQAELSRFTGSCSGRSTDKFKKLKKFYGETGVPLIEGCQACFECKVVSVSKAGDHDIFIGEIVNSYVDDTKKPLFLFRQGYYKLGESLGGW